MTSQNLIAPALFFLSAAILNASAKEASNKASFRFAKILETHLSLMKSSRYQHKTEINEKAGVWNCDCSGLIGHILRRHFPEAYLYVDGPTFPNRVRPLAANYCETFIKYGQNEHNGSPWREITKVSDLLPGDILAWKSLKIVKGKSTGHVLMIASNPKLDKNGLYLVRIIDSTTGLHANDSRTKHSPGLGSGNIWLSADKEGNLNGFKSNLHRSLNLKNTIAAGRIVPLSGPASPANKGDQAYLNITPEAARVLAKKQGFKCRIISQDGKTFSVPRKTEKSCLDFIIENNKVIRLIRG